MENDNDGLLLFLDFEKAFDSVEWNFVQVLKQFNFGENFIHGSKFFTQNQFSELKTMDGFLKLAK